MSYRKKVALGLGAALLIAGMGVAVWAVAFGGGEKAVAEREQPHTETDGSNAPVLSPQQALESFALPPGFRAEVVAAEPLVQDPVALDIDAQGRLWVVEMRGFMNSIVERGEGNPPRGQVVVLEDQNGDGRMDEKTVFLDSLALPRSVMATAGGVLVGEPPHLWLARDTDGDLRADTKKALREDYGSREGNPEWLPNSLKWGLDNWVHTAQYDGRLRRTPGGWEHDSTLTLGQWGLAMSNAGRFYRTYNSDPLTLSVLDPSYYARNPDLVGPEGARVSIAKGAKAVWPIHATPGVNRAYREGMLREDSTLTRFTAASGGAVYRGNRYPQSFQGDAFVLGPAGNFVRRFEITHQENGRVTAKNAYDQAEFMASTDERFRPVNAVSAPDGTLYVVDMYQGVIQHRNYLSQYLKDYIQRRGLETPAGLGRIYRIVYEPNPPREERPRLASATNQELVRRLTDPNGWWRDTAQQLLVERRATEVAPALRDLVRSSKSTWGRLHALWTLDGLGELSLETVRRALQDAASPVRAAAVRVAEPWLRNGNAQALKAVAALVKEDAAPRVRLQGAASLGEAPPPAADAAMADLLTRAAGQPFLVDAVVSGLEGRELAFLKRLTKRADWSAKRAGYAEAVQTLAATIINTGESEKIDRLIALVGDQAGLARWQRLALLGGIETLFPRAQGDVKPPLKLSERPSTLDQALQASDEVVRRRVKQVAGRLAWPGKPGYDPVETTLVTAKEKQRFRTGRQQYLRVCATCHRADGTGQQDVAASLVGSRWVQGQQKDLVRILLNGKEGDVGVMPGHRSQLSDEQIAAIATYVRNAWTNEARPVTPSTVEEVRNATATRKTPWTDEELSIIDH